LKCHVAFLVVSSPCFADSFNSVKFPWVDGPARILPPMRSRSTGPIRTTVERVAFQSPFWI
jgi:hypothetical protein